MKQLEKLKKILVNHAAFNDLLISLWVHGYDEKEMALLSSMVSSAIASDTQPLFPEPEPQTYLFSKMDYEECFCVANESQQPPPVRELDPFKQKYQNSKNYQSPVKRSNYNRRARRK